MFRPWESEENEESTPLQPMPNLDNEDWGSGADIPWEEPGTSQSVTDYSENQESAPLLPMPNLDEPGTSQHIPVCNAPRKRFAFSLNKQAQRLLQSVYNFFQHQKWQGEFDGSIGAALENTAKATNLSHATVSKYIKSGLVDTPGKKRPRKNVKKYGKIDEFTMSLMRRTVYVFYSKGIAPTSDLLLKAMQQATKDTEYIFPYKKTALKGILHELGFKWKKVKTGTILAESSRIETWRFRYLHDIEMYRREGRNIVFLDETWFNFGDKDCSGWTDSSRSCAAKSRTSGKGERLIIIHAGGENGWVDKAQFVMRTKTAGNFDYHDDMDGFNFEKWFGEQLLPSLPPLTIIVMDNAKYHSRMSNKIPKKTLE